MTSRLTVCAAALLLLGSCAEGGVETATCAMEDTRCGESCVNVKADVRHCGGCGVTCGANEVCAAGRCRRSCPSGQTDCGGGCFTLASSRQHCGACNRACAEGEACIDTQCQLACPEGQTRCGGACFTLASSSQHCGACNNACAVGTVCDGGKCTPTCSGGLEACDGACRDTRNDRAHCGGCAHACASGELCVGGACTLNCGAGLTQCGAGCFDTRTDRTHCGSCGKACTDDELCVDGACVLHCAPGLTACDGKCRDASADRAHCGACGKVCGAAETCREGKCVLACSGFAPDACNGLCTNRQVDPTNCGACSHHCAQGEICIYGFCASPNGCAPPNEICGAACTVTRVDPSNCGACGHTCSAPVNAAPVCAQGQCISACMPGYGDCDSDLLVPGGNGCETSLTSTTRDCGACGRTCARPPNASAACVASTCGLGVCEPNFANCDGVESNGCETDLRTSRDHCGACGAACPAGFSCRNSVCGNPTGEDCSSPIPVVAGLNTINWTASVRDYITSIPSCGVTYNPDGPDIVLVYNAPATRTVKFSFAKPADTRWHVLITSTCGVLSPFLACVSDYTPTTLSSSDISVTAGNNYFLHVVDSTSGANPLSNPLLLTVTEN